MPDFGVQSLQAEIVSVGTELLLGQIVDTNAVYLSQLLPELGIGLYYRWTVGDNPGRLADTLRSALSRSDIVFTIGGLGPTQDDLTKETAAEVAGDPLRLDEGAAEKLRSFFASRGYVMPESNMKQALVPVNGIMIPNPNGTAPGAVFELPGSKMIVVLPGPPREFIPMVRDWVKPFFAEKMGVDSTVIRSRVLRLAGIGESLVEDRTKHLMVSENPTLAPYAKPGECHLRITARAANADEAEALIDKMDADVVSVLGDRVYGRDEQTLEEIVVDLLTGQKLTLATAESCTGGLISNRITDVSGSSQVFLMGICSYSNEAKISLLSVDRKLIEEHGAVSQEVACAMAEGVRKLSGADLGIAVTGIAGPTGGSDEKPVGLVYLALADGEETLSKRIVLPGDRLNVKLLTSQNALDMIRTRLNSCRT